MNCVFYCFVLYSVNCTQMVSMRPFQLNIWVFLPGELLFIVSILYMTRAGVSPLIVLKFILYGPFSFLGNKRCLGCAGKYMNEELSSAWNRVKNGCESWVECRWKSAPLLRCYIRASSAPSFLPWRRKRTQICSILALPTLPMSSIPCISGHRHKKTSVLPTSHQIPIERGREKSWAMAQLSVMHTQKT